MCFGFGLWHTTSCSIHCSEYNRPTNGNGTWNVVKRIAFSSRFAFGIPRGMFEGVE